MLKIGITGGIGSGKSVICRVFETLGIPVYNADQRARYIINHDPNIHKALKQLLGADIYNAEGLNRQQVAALVFNNTDLLNQLNAITHPVVLEDSKNWLAMQRGPYVIKEAALLFESGSHKQLDYVIGVSAPLNLRVHRTIQRDGTTEEAVLQRIGKQMNEEEKLSQCDAIIYNNDVQAVIPQVWLLHQQFLNA